MAISIYLITNLATGMGYVGQTCRAPEDRFAQHIYGRNSKKSCRRLAEAMRCYGPQNFVIQRLSVHESKEEAAGAERAMIVLFGTRDESLGYNLAIGGTPSSGFKWSPESRSKHSENMMGNKRGAGKECLPPKRAKLSASLKGHVVAEETRAKIRAAVLANPKCRGFKMSEEAKRKIAAANTGRRHTPEHRAKLSSARKGKAAWNKGRAMSPEQRVKLSVSHTGKKLSEAHRQNLSIALKKARAR
jgi:group I intron endonuclease